MMRAEWWRFTRQLTSLHKTLQSIQKHLESIPKKDEPHKHTGDLQDAGPIDVLVSKLTLPVAVDEYYKSTKDGHPRGKWGWLKFGLEVGGLVALVAYVIITARTFGEIKKQSASAQQQTEIVRKQFKAIDRPWLSASANLVGPIVIDHSGPHVTLTVRLKNTGNSPAVHVEVMCNLRPVYLPPPFAKSDPDCENFRSGTEKGGGALFPGDTMEFPATSVILPSLLAAYRAQASRAYLQWTVCIAYGFTFENSDHKTTVEYILHGPSRTNIDIGVGVKNLTMKNVTLTMFNTDAN